MRPELRSRSEHGTDLDLLSWRFVSPMIVASTAAIGGGYGVRQWILNLQVPHDYRRTDVDGHVAQIARELELRDKGVGMMTAAVVRDVTHGHEMGVDVWTTVGVKTPIWAASDEEVGEDHVAPGTINIVAFLPVRLSDAGLLNALTTVTEAKSQALWDGGIPATGTASDAVCVVCPTNGESDRFGGPRSVWGSRLARAVHRAILSGLGGRYR
ncbi:MAG: adenosylcobinamide amidohydrolase [Acidobacteriota bacterium]|nr:adenosylcobinamide amidohydrolase [Acidobacteriota bacterium]